MTVTPELVTARGDQTVSPSVRPGVRERLAHVATDCGVSPMDLWDAILSGGHGDGGSDVDTIDAQLTDLIDRHGEAVAARMVRAAGLEKLAEAFSQHGAAVDTVRSYLHDLRNADELYRIETHNLGAGLSRVLRILTALTTIADLSDDAVTTALQALHIAVTSADTDRVRAQYIDRTHLLSVITKQKQILAAHGLARPAVLCANDPKLPGYSVLYFDLPRLRGDRLGRRRQIARHVALRDLHVLTSHVAVLPADHQHAPVWDRSGIAEQQLRIRTWAATPVEVRLSRAQLVIVTATVVAILTAIVCLTLLDYIA